MLLGDKNSVTGGSGKVVDSKPEDRIFLYYSDHGGPGVLGKCLIINFIYIYNLAHSLVIGLPIQRVSCLYFSDQFITFFQFNYFDRQNG